jgi:hypothetical protein
MNRGRRRLEPLPLKALYTLSELEQAIGISRKRVLRLLRTCGVVLLAEGRSVYVPLPEIRRKVEPLWEAICEAQAALEGG